MPTSSGFFPPVSGHYCVCKYRTKSSCIRPLLRFLDALLRTYDPALKDRVLLSTLHGFYLILRVHYSLCVLEIHIQELLIM